MLRQRFAQFLAFGKLHGVDAGAVQDQRQEMADSGVLVDHEAQWRVRRRQRRRGDRGRRFVGGGR
jgi:hypothetical protein